MKRSLLHLEQSFCQGKDKDDVDNFFAFDAPKWIDFGIKKYRRKARKIYKFWNVHDYHPLKSGNTLNSAVLDNHKASSNHQIKDSPSKRYAVKVDDPDLDEEIDDSQISDIEEEQDDDVVDEWFQREHPEHEQEVTFATNTDLFTLKEGEDQLCEPNLPDPDNDAGDASTISFIEPDTILSPSLLSFSTPGFQLLSNSKGSSSIFDNTDTSEFESSQKCTKIRGPTNILGSPLRRKISFNQSLLLSHPQRHKPPINHSIGDENLKAYKSPRESFYSKLSIDNQLIQTSDISCENNDSMGINLDEFTMNDDNSNIVEEIENAPLPKVMQAFLKKRQRNQNYQEPLFTVTNKNNNIEKSYISMPSPESKLITMRPQRILPTQPTLNGSKIPTSSTSNPLDGPRIRPQRKVKPVHIDELKDILEKHNAKVRPRPNKLSNK